MQAFFYFFSIFLKWAYKWDWAAIIAYFGIAEWLNQYVVGKIGLELGLYLLCFSSNPQNVMGPALADLELCRHRHNTTSESPLREQNNSECF